VEADGAKGSMIRLMRLILICVFVYVCISVLARITRRWGALKARREARRAEKSNPASNMVRDPVCGTYIASHEAVTIHTNGRDVHFCSTKCRDKYVNRLG
jgi:ribosomal protein L32